MRVTHMRHPWVISIFKALVKDKEKFEKDAKLQFKIHKIASYVWLVNMVIASIWYFGFRSSWDSGSTYYLVMVSLYANFATDYGAVSASLAADRSLE